MRVADMEENKNAYWNMVRSPQANSLEDLVTDGRIILTGC